jgi:hypothetical protein
MWEPDYVEPSAFMEYVSGAFEEDGPDEAEASLAVSAASRAVDFTCRRQFGRVDAPEAKSYRARPTGLYGAYVLDIDDVAAGDVSGVLIDGEAPATLPQFWPLNAPVKTRMAAPGRGTYAVTLPWGWPEVPRTIEQATLIQANRFFKRRDAPFGVAGSPDSGTEMRLLARLDPDVALMVRKYQRHARPG